MNKQIEEMAKSMCRNYGTQACVPCDAHATCMIHLYAVDVYNAGYRKQSEWISVEERLPDIDGKYLVYTSKDFISTQYYYCTNAFGFETWDVTHWMPLPMPPKGDEGNEHC